MKALNRKFSLKEKILLLILSLLLLGLAYYAFVDMPIRDSLARAQSDAVTMASELEIMNAKLALMRRMRSEVEDITAGGTASQMGSYNSSKEEIALLNDILKDATEYSVNFSRLTRSGDQIRRGFTLEFTTEGYDAMTSILSRLAESRYRCLLDDVRCSARRDASMRAGEITVTVSAAFYETMVGGTPDAGLPEG